MSHVGIWSLILALATPVVHADSTPPAEGYFPNGALSDTLNQEQSERRRAEGLEREAATQRANLEKAQREAQRQIAQSQFEIETLKVRQAKAQDELGTIAVSRKGVDEASAKTEAERKTIQDNADRVLADLKEEQTVLSVKQDQLNQQLAKLTEARARSEREIYLMKMDVARLGTENARTEARMATNETKRNALEADETKARADLEHQRTLSAQTEKKAKTEIERLDREVAEAAKSKAQSEAEHLRLASETERLQALVGEKREARNEAVDQANDAQGLKVRAQVNSTMAKTGVTRTELGRAVAANQTELQLSVGKPWVTAKRCAAYRRPERNSAPVGYYSPGRKLVGRMQMEGWIEIAAGTNQSFFVGADCGTFGG